MKLSEPQKLVIRLMRSGRELKYTTTYGWRVQSTKNGGWVSFRESTIKALDKMNLIDGLKLTDKGKEVEL